MSTLVIFIIGFIVTVITFIGALLIGLQEAADPVQSRPQDLVEFEKELVDRPDIG